MYFVSLTTGFAFHTEAMIHIECQALFSSKNEKIFLNVYGKCPKILHITIFVKMAYAKSTDPDQTAPSGAV